MASSATVSSAPRRTNGLWLEAIGAALRRRFRTEWFGSPLHLALLSGPHPEGFAAFPADPRPANANAGRALLEGRYTLAGETLSLGPGADPWNRPSPSLAFAMQLHGFTWLGDLLTQGEAGAREALRLVSAWRSVFGRWNTFSWSGAVLERRTFNLACAAGTLVEHADEARALPDLLARHVRQLLIVRDPADRITERAAVAACAAATLSGRAGARLLDRACARLEWRIVTTVRADGTHASRSPEAGLDLLFDLIALDDALAQRNLQTPDEAARAIDRLDAALRLFTLADGALACFQGGEQASAARVSAARARSEPDGAVPMRMTHGGYERLDGGQIEVLVDAGAPATGALSASACAQPAAIEVTCGGERLITNAGWSPRAPSAQALRLTAAASTVSLGRESAGAPLSGWRAKVLGARLVAGAREVEVRRTNAEAGVWLDVVHDGWVRGLGLLHERRLYLDLDADELRGEDKFTSVRATRPRVIPYEARFHLPPEVSAAVARDNKSVLLRGRSATGWWLRNDAAEVRVEPAVCFRDGRQVPTHQVVLMGHIRADKGGKVRWKLARAEG
jgi:uncharacterized heparinase superfamily protein